MNKQLTVAEIRSKLEAMLSDRRFDDAWIAALSQDSRTGVRKLADVFQNKRSQMEQNTNRIQAMIEHDRTYRISHGQWVAGIDEAGRGCLAGPVVAAAVILPEDFIDESINDSKQMSPQAREFVYDRILEHAVAYGVGIVSASDIDHYNILQATYEAMRRAVTNLGVQPAALINDAVTIPGVMIPQIPVIHGDALSYSIAAASILAKVTRDRIMKEYALEYPQYGFDQHVGYGTSAHLQALQTHGPCPIHRLTFAKVL